MIPWNNDTWNHDLFCDGRNMTDKNEEDNYAGNKKYLETI